MLKVKKARNCIIGVIGLALLLSFGFAPSQGSAATLPTIESNISNENAITATSRVVSVYDIVRYDPPWGSSVWYEDEYGYKGTIYLFDKKVWGIGSWGVEYRGTVYCEGNCPN